MAWVSTVNDIGHLNYSYARIYQRIVEELVVEIHHRRRHSFFFEFSFDTVVIHFVPGNFHFLTEPGIFCCVRLLVCLYLSANL